MAAVESGGISADAVTECTLLELHNRLGHLAFDTLERMADAPGSGVKLTSRVRLNCLTCAQGKQHKVNQSKKDTGQNAPVDKIGGVICSDIKGPMTPRDRHGNRYMINFVDHSSNYVRAFLAKNKVEATKKFEHFLVFFEKEHNCRIHVLRTDGGGEYMNVEEFCRATGVRRQVSEANNQASNGKAERMHRTILNMARCMLFASGLPLKFWGYAVDYAAYVLNRSACSANTRRMSPIEVLTGKCPDMAGIVTFGSPCTVYRDPGKKAWQPRAEVGMIVGKNDETKGFKVYIPKDMVVVTTQHIENVETLDSKQNVQLQAQLKREDPELWRSIEERGEATQQKEKVPIKKKKQAKGKKKKKKAHGTDGVGEDAEGDQGSEGAGEQLAPIAASAAPAARMQTRHMGAKHVPVQVVHAVVTPDPRNYREAMRDARANKWKEAIKVEFEALESNNTWEVVARPRNSKLLHTKWVFKTKTHADGTVERYKGRLVVCGNEQEYGIDYIVTFSAVLDLTTGKLIFVMAHVWEVPARHGDVPSAYVKADKEEGLEIYLYIPDGMEIPDELLALLGVKHKGQLALRLIKSLYGLKQAGRLWNRLLHKILVKLGFCQCYTDGCLYYKRDASGVTLVGVYVDDLLVTGTSNARVDAFFEDMAVLELKDLGVVSKFLGIGFEYDKDKGWLLEQRQAILGMLDKFGLSEASAVRVPIGGEHESDVDGELLPNDGAGSPQRPTVQTFQSLVGSLLWVARCTRPDIAYAVHRVTRRTHEPRVSDWRLAEKIARYLKGTVDTKFAMHAPRGSMSEDTIVVEGYSDADFAGDRVDRKSVSGGVLMVCGMVAGWICKKQGSVALSTMEAEFVAASQVTAEMLGIVELLSEIGIKVEVPYKLHVDNQAAIKQIEGEDTSGRAKHIDIRLKFIKDLSRNKGLNVSYCESKLMRADILTKTLPAPRLEELRVLVMLTT
ncbi:Integrase catalytic core protein [Phytophthora cinnamomi]|uniref:Integrase catalytic core protein n=1 Tax=Phytophthora cinnamomi TaxID=4785 RepID=UPI003559EE74|nr:Integrase catalytic core protein [Phytophthora cinnamomi]